MDLHPTPFPGKRCPSATSTKKDNERAKPSKNPAPPPTRPKRAFGVARSSNIPAEKPASKPPPTKASKPWKPSGTSGRRDAPVVSTSEKVPDNVSGGGGSGKTKAGSKKNHRVGFQEPVAAAAATAANNIERSGQEDGARTPMSSIKPAMLGTPYLSAQNCSKCRVDRLESASYWLSQVRLAESAGKHFVSAAFFRLALECHAQPFPSLQSELKHYVARHGAASKETLWEELREAYGLSDGQSNTDPSNCNKIDADLFELEGFESKDPNEANCETLKDESLECDVTDSPHKDLSAEELIEHTIDNSTSELKEDIAEPKEDIGTQVSVVAKTTPPSSGDSSRKHKTSGTVAIPHGGGKKSSSSSVSGKKSYGENSKKGSIPSFNDLSSNTKTRSCGGSAGKGGEASSQSRLGSKLSGGKLTRRNGDGAQMSQNDEQMSKGQADEKSTGPHLSEILNSDETGEDTIANESA